MKIKIILKIVWCSLLVFFFLACEKKEINQVFLEPATPPSGTALVISGAGARVSHEIALIERLDELGELDDLAFISGVSAGSIMALFLNRILDDNPHFGWENFKKIFFSLKQEDLFSNPNNDLPVDTRNTWHFFDRILTDSLGIKYLSTDLIFPTVMTSIRLDDKTISRISNIHQFHSITNKPIEGLMASISFPSVFPSIRIDGVDYVDSGFLDNFPYKAVLEYQMIRKKPFKKIIIVSYQGNKNVQWKTELDQLLLRNTREDIIVDLLNASGLYIDPDVEQALLNILEYIQNVYPDFSSRTWVYSPDIKNPPYFPIFQFDGAFSEKAYDLERDWVQKNPPPLP